jgi:hypothetical protein
MLVAALSDPDAIDEDPISSYTKVVIGCGRLVQR